MIKTLPIVLLFVLLVVSSALAQPSAPAGNPLNEPLGDPGVVPVGEDGQPLNLNFETGTLAGWKAEGEAFANQPIKGDIAELRPADRKRSEHTGQYWIGTYERARDLPQGTLTSPTFTVTHPYASFLVGGGSSRQTRVDLVHAADNRVLYGASGKNEENLRPVIVDLTQHQGKKVFLRILDQASGGWGHINFDDFRFHSTRPRFKSLVGELPVPEKTALYPHAGLSAEEAAKAMVVPPGFKVQVAAAEPDVQQPIAMAIDDRGRIWIAEAYEYPRRAPGDKGRDRILIFEDTDLDGRLDRRTVFYEGLNLVSGLEVGFGGAWVGAAPYLLFIPDKDGDDHPDGEPVKLLDGWGYEDTHETLNSFIWGPDGWLYGCHGVFTHSRVGKPGTADDQRVRINAGIWRYHPVRHVFEVFAHGTSNPWGLDYDQYGNFFATACVIPHIFHIIPGARYERQAGQHFNPYTYDDIKTIADHRHYTGNQWNDDNRRQSDTLGGGHAHAGCMIYQGGAWPEKYHGAVFMNNIHGNRMNVDLLEPQGSGFVAHHGQDFLLARDQWSQMLYMTYGPDGQVWVIDWYDMQQCHLREPGKHDRSNGRIYRIVYNDAKPVRVDLQKASIGELVSYLAHENQWYARHARRRLQELAMQGLAGQKANQEMSLALDRLFNAKQESKYLNMLGLHAVTGQLSKREYELQRTERSPTFEDLLNALRINVDGQPHAEARLLEFVVQNNDEDTRVAELIKRLTGSGKSPVLRLAIASQLQRVPYAVRWGVLESLTSHSEDATDHNLPLMYWYAMEPLAEVDPPRALALALKAGENIPILKEFMIRRIGAGDPAKSLDLLVDGLSKAKDDSTRLTFLRGMNESLKGRKSLKAPAGWQEVSATLAKADSADVRFEATALAVGFGDQEAASSLARAILDAKQPLGQRRQAITTLARAQSPLLLPTLITLLSQGDLRGDALRGLASFDDARVPQSILGAYGDLLPAERRDALSTLCSRPSYARALFDAVAGGKVPASHLTADLVTNLRNLNDEALNKRIEQVWGIVRSSPEEKKKLIDDYKRLIAATAGQVSSGTQPPATSHQHSPSELGRAVFAKTCQQCHTLFGTGGKVGPDITGSQRANLDYLLSNILDPSAVMAKEYQPTVVRTADGRVITGILKEETAASISLQTQNELVVIAKGDIDEQKLSDKSMMPDDLLRPLSPHEVRALVDYLGSEGQSPMAATLDNVGGIFSGKDLAGWIGDPQLWSVENGEIVGRSPGLKKNEFLVSELSVADFRLELDVKLTPNTGNSGVQIRSRPIENGLMRGYQCDIGAGWWGKLYEEHGRALLEPQGAEALVKKEDWNHYEIIAAGSRVRAWLNGHLCFDRDDPEGARRGVIGLQLHSGGPLEVRFKNLKLTLLPGHVPARPYPASKAVGTLRLPAPEPQPAAQPRDAQPAQVRFEKFTLDRAFRSEGVGMGDFNNDGFLDIAAGSVWYENPGTRGQEPGTRSQGGGKADHSPLTTDHSLWRMHVLGEKPNSFDIKTYGDTFMNWAEDVNGDGRLDLIVVDFPGKPTWWFENQGSGVRGQESGGQPPATSASHWPWKRHQIVPVTNNESPQYVDVDGDGRRELVYGDGANRIAVARPQANPLVEWQATPISAPGDVKVERFYHGLGIGDINRDGRDDLLVPHGWWENPGAVGNAVSGVPGGLGNLWTFHPAPFGQPQAQMHVYDFDGDGDNDVVGSSAHRRGIWWYEQDGKDWKTHLIDDSIAQTHALILADMNGDGLPDLVTGKRYYAHNGRDPGEDEPPELAWYELSRNAAADGRAEPVWTKRVIDNDSGVGTQFEVHDMNADGLLDIIVANKRGVFYFEQEPRPAATK